MMITNTGEMQDLHLLSRQPLSLAAADELVHMIVIGNVAKAVRLADAKLLQELLEVSSCRGHGAVLVHCDCASFSCMCLIFQNSTNTSRHNVEVAVRFNRAGWSGVNLIGMILACY